MSPQTVAMILKRFEEPDEVRAMTLGRFELVRLGGMTLGRATCQPGPGDRDARRGPVLHPARASRLFGAR